MPAVTKEKEKQALLQEFGVKYDTVQRLADTVELHHQKAYTEAALKHLKDKEGNLDYKLLKDSKVRSAMADQMADYYVEQAKEYFRVDEKASKLSDMQKEMLINAYAGITRGQLKSEIHRAEEEFTLQHFGRRVDEIKRRISEQLVPATYAHIQDTPEHKKAILKELDLEGKLDAELVRVEDLIPLMAQHHRDGAVPQRLYEKLPAYKAMQKQQKVA
mgnify:CR=1 FL=1